MGFDLVFMAILAMAFLYGFMRGFLRQLLSLAGLITAFYMAAYHPEKAITFLTPYIHNPQVLKISGAVLTFIVVYLLFSLASVIISFLVKGAIGLADRLLGGFFAIIKATVFLIALAMLLVSFDITRDFVLNSKTGPYLVSVGTRLLASGKKLWEERWNSGKNLKTKSNSSSAQK